MCSSITTSSRFSVRSFCPPIRDDLLLSCDFFTDLYPLDGGGALVTPQIISNLHDANFANQILQHNALSDFGELPRLDHHRFERWRTVQKSCWLNRFYWIVPLAKQQAVTKDRKLGKIIVHAIRHFIDTCPAPQGKDQILAHAREVYDVRDHIYSKMSHDDIQKDDLDIRYIWFDFEPASRMLHWIYALHFLKMGDGIESDDAGEIIASLYRHAEVIYYVEKHGRTLRARDNHQCLRGLTLLYAACFFQGHGLSDEFLKLGVEIMRFHIRESFFDDGALKEISPSYQMFQMWHVRDAFLLSKQYGFDLEPDTGDRLNQQANYIRGVSDPSEKTTVLNDGFSVPTRRFIETCRQSTADVHDDEATHYFQDAGVAVYKRPGLFFLLDASPFTGSASHYHAGKNAIVLWVGDTPFIVDSGCCPYDDEGYLSWYRLGEAHCGLLVDGYGDGDLQSMYHFASFATLQCDGWSQDDEGAWRISSTLTSNVSAWDQVSWRRTVMMGHDMQVKVHDQVICPGPKALTFIFNLHPRIRPEVLDDKVILHGSESSVQMLHQCDQPSEIELRQGRCYFEGAHHVNQRVCVTLRGEKAVDSRWNLSPLGDVNMNRS